MTRDVNSLRPSEALKLQALFELDKEGLRERYRAYEAELKTVGLRSENQFIEYVFGFKDLQKGMTYLLRKLQNLFQDKYAQDIIPPKDKLEIRYRLSQIQHILDQLEGKEPVYAFLENLHDLRDWLKSFKL